MKFSILSLFPEQVGDFLNQSIIGRAINKNIIELNLVNIRDFAINEFGKVDDTLYGGGTGMLMQCDPVFDAYQSISADSKPYVIYVSPKGNVLDQKKVIELSNKEHICIICGHYEGIDSRVIDEIVDEEVSIGDYVLTGGEIASVVIVDSVARMIEGVLPNSEAYTNESHMSGALEAPQYTKPRTWHEINVPEVLANGNQAVINEYNRMASLLETMKKRPDLLEKMQISSDEWQKLLAMNRQN